MENSEWITIDDDIDEHDDIGDWLVWILLIQHTCATLVKIILMIDSTQIALNSSSSCSSPSCSCKLLAQHQPVLDCLATPALARPPSLPTLLKENLNVAKQRPSPSANAAATRRPPFFFKNFWHCSRSAKIRILLDFFFLPKLFNACLPPSVAFTARTPAVARFSSYSLDDLKISIGKIVILHQKCLQQKKSEFHLIFNFIFALGSTILTPLGQ